MSPATNQKCARATVTAGRAAERAGTLHLVLMIVALVAVAVNAAVDGAAFVYLLVVTVAASGSMTALALKGYIAVVESAVRESQARRTSGGGGGVGGVDPFAEAAAMSARQMVIVEQAIVMPDDEGTARLTFTATGRDLVVTFKREVPPSAWACPARIREIPAPVLATLPASPPSKGIES